MAEVVGYSTSLMTEPDLRAIAVYPRDQLAGAPTPPPVLAANDPALRAGEAMDVDNGMACCGQGAAGLCPTLAGRRVAQRPGADTLRQVITGGRHGVATDAAPTDPGMPAFGWMTGMSSVSPAIFAIAGATRPRPRPRGSPRDHAGYSPPRRADAGIRA